VSGVMDYEEDDRFRRLHDPLDETLNWSCGFAETPNHPNCLDEAIWHGFTLDSSRQYIIAMMACCDTHKPVMALSADYIHRMDSPCGIPGAWFLWPENECRLPEDGTAIEQPCHADGGAS
jgi:hypothetical protein